MEDMSTMAYRFLSAESEMDLCSLKRNEYLLVIYLLLFAICFHKTC